MPKPVNTDAPPNTPPEMLSCDDLARLLNCSSRHVLRMTDQGILPPSIKLGWLRRWPRQRIDEWIAAGCQPCRRRVGQ